MPCSLFDSLPVAEQLKNVRLSCTMGGEDFPVAAPMGRRWKPHRETLGSEEASGDLQDVRAEKQGEEGAPPQELNRLEVLRGLRVSIWEACYARSGAH